MSGFAGVRRWLQLDRPVEHEIDDELAFHLERATEELTAQGRTPEAARLEALRRFGDLGRYRDALTRIDQERLVERRRRDWLGVIGRSVAHGWRGMRRNPGFTAIVAVTLGLGIGVNAAMFGVLDRLLLRAPDLIREPDMVRRLYVRRSFAGREFVTSSITYPDLKDFDRVQAFERVSAIRPLSMTYGSGAEARELPAYLVSPGFFELLGVTPQLGRFLIPADDSLTPATGTVVISHGLWQREFGGDPSIIGRQLELGEGRYQVVGVAPRGFTGVDHEQVDGWIATRTGAAEMVSGGWETGRGFYWLSAIARVRGTHTLAQAEAEATSAHRGGRSEDKHYDAEAAVIAGPLLKSLGPSAPPEAKVSFWVAGVSLAVLLVACANVANLLLFRAVRRRREIALRLALGISRGRLVAELLSESVLLAVVAGLGAVMLAAWGGEALRQLLFPQLAWPASPLSIRVAGFTLLVSIAAGVLAGLVPAWLESRPDLLAALKEGGAQGGSQRSLVRGALVVTQAALSVALLVAAGLFLLSFQRVRSIDLGMQPERVLLVSPQFPRGATDARIREVFDAALQRIAALPGVDQAAASTSVPFRGNWAEDLTVPGIDSLPRVNTGGPYIDAVTAGYFGTLGVGLVRGRGFTAEDHAGAARVTVVGETMARLLWPGGDALGKCMRIGGDSMPCSEVVGVAKDVRRNSFVAGDRMQYYVPLLQFRVSTPGALYLRTSGDPVSLMGPARALLAELAPELRYTTLEPMTMLVNPEYRGWRLGATLFTAFGGLALLVAGVGLYSLLSYGVAQRTREIGVRTALGAHPSRIVALVLREGLALTGVGLLLGLTAAMFVGRAVAPLLFATSPLEPGVYIGVMLVLSLIALVAGAVPAWRASRVDPMTALRSE